MTDFKQLVRKVNNRNITTTTKNKQTKSNKKQQQKEKKNKQQQQALGRGRKSHFQNWHGILFQMSIYQQKNYETNKGTGKYG